MKVDAASSSGSLKVVPMWFILRPDKLSANNIIWNYGLSSNIAIFTFIVYKTWQHYNSIQFRVVLLELTISSSNWFSVNLISLIALGIIISTFTLMISHSCPSWSASIDAATEIEGKKIKISFFLAPFSAAAVPIMADYILSFGARNDHHGYTLLSIKLESSTRRYVESSFSSWQW